MKILATSDLHGFYPPLQECDVLVIGGDITKNGHISEVEEFLEWLKSNEEYYKHAVIIAGNHDWAFRDTHIMHELFNSEKVHYLYNEEVVLDGVRFWGSPYTPEFQGWAFMKEDKGLADVWNLIPDNVDVLVTHGGPYGELDFCYGRNVGSSSLRQRLMFINPQVHIFGHIHEGYGYAEFAKDSNGNRIKLYNVAYCDGKYIPGQPPMLIEVDK